MKLFKGNYDKPGPGVPKNAPEKKGFARFFEILGRDFGDFVKLNIRVALCCLPAQVCFVLMLVFLVLGNSALMLIFGVLALAASCLVAPAFTAQSFFISRRLRNDPGFVEEDFKKIFKENFRSLLVPGALYALITGSQTLVVFFYIGSPQTMHIAVAAVYFFATLLFGMAVPYFFLQKAYLELGTPALIKNSLFFTLGYFPRSLAGALLHFLLSGQWMLYVCMLLPEALPIAFLYIIFIGHFLGNLVQLMWIWPQVDKTFKIGETLAQRQQEQLDHVKPLDEEE